MAGKVKGTVTDINEQGCAVTDLTAGQLADAPRDESVRIKCEGHVTCGLYTHDTEHPEMTFVAVFNQGEFLELQLVGESASRFLGIRVGNRVTVEW